MVRTFGTESNSFKSGESRRVQKSPDTWLESYSAPSYQLAKFQWLLVIAKVAPMRIAYLLLLVPAALSSGCAGMIARTGIDPTELKTKEEVRARFGEPTVIGSLDGTDGAFYEDYFTHWKIATQDYTFEVMGLPLEPYYVSKELYLTAQRAIMGQTLRFTYDSNGKPIKIQLDGDPNNYWMHNSSQQTLSPSPSQAIQDPALSPRK